MERSDYSMNCQDCQCDTGPHTRPSPPAGRPSHRAGSKVQAARDSSDWHDADEASFQLIGAEPGSKFSATEGRETKNDMISIVKLAGVC